ncbi:MAG: GNAT family N-acetyltransferase [Dehalococcoidia bacterium]
MPAAAVASFRIRRLRDAEAIRARLRREPAYAAYALGQLAPRLFPLVSCWEADGPDGAGLTLFSRGGLGDAVFVMGAPSAIAAILTLHQGPRHNFATLRPEHLPAFERVFRLTSRQPMMRMVVDRRTFRPAPTPASFGVTVRRLTAADTRALNRLYNTEGQPTYYSAGHVEQGMYHGVWEGRQLVAVAGTHVISPEEGVAVVGNVFTHPERRSVGYGGAATGATTGALLDRCAEVALTVDPTNTPAVRAYLRLGYREDVRLLEAAVVRRSLTATGAALAARLAAWRGRGDGEEVIRRSFA